MKIYQNSQNEHISQTAAKKKNLNWKIILSNNIFVPENAVSCYKLSGISKKVLPQSLVTFQHMVF